MLANKTENSDFSRSRNVITMMVVKLSYNYSLGMATIGCTGKLLNELGTNKPIVENQQTSLSNWHANLIIVDRRKYVLFTNDLTLFSFLIRWGKKPTPLDFDKLFRLGLLKSLMNERLEDHLLQNMLNRQGTITITRTNSRSVLGSMTELFFEIEYMLFSLGDPTEADLSEINRGLNRIPMKGINYALGIEELKRRLVGD